MKVIKTKGVSFNVVDPFQKRLFDHAARHTNFSAYVKSLIQRDMEGGTGNTSTIDTAVSPITDDIVRGFV
ncbi:hypothetical protein P9850_02185 [Anoxybacillus rupiensis]|uniref:Uncharacterized protein n=1 Tax=Anoxybacteroides rupiense TaxID=311460 RepID=A0ABD5IS73_9BACL|nr:hypothetical protein [Anoxybacillus rupiensis]